jgi:hypothetical protein
MTMAELEVGPGGVPMANIADCRAMRVRVVRDDKPRLVSGQPGVLVVLAAPASQAPGLVLLADEPEQPSERVERCGLFVFLAPEVRAMLAECLPDNANVVTQSAVGMEHLVLTWRGNLPIRASRSPVRWPGTLPGSREALIGAFGFQARRALTVLELMRRNPYRPTFPG